MLGAHLETGSLIRTGWIVTVLVMVILVEIVGISGFLFEGLGISLFLCFIFGEEELRSSEVIESKRDEIIVMCCAFDLYSVTFSDYVISG
jgi:hypothetical protein